MGVPLTDSGTGDMFLRVKGAKGDINGEAQDQTHKDEIEVLGWSWGMEGKASLAGGTTPTGRSTLRELRIHKRVDKASTALMAALRANELIKEAVLTLRKAGTTPLEYLKITIEDARVRVVDIQGGDNHGSASVQETIAFTFNKIDVTYTPQGPDGQPLPKTNFKDVWEAGH